MLDPDSDGDLNPDPPGSGSETLDATTGTGTVQNGTVPPSVMDPDPDTRSDPKLFAGSGSGLVNFGSGYGSGMINLGSRSDKLQFSVTKKHEIC